MNAARFALQRTHLTAPATVAKYVDSAVTKSDADLVMLDLEDSIPRGDEAALRAGRDQVVRAMNELDWGRKLRFFRPRGHGEDPGRTDVVDVVTRAGRRIEGLVYPKVDGPEEVRALDATLTRLEHAAGLRQGHIKIAVLIESVAAEELAFAVAHASPRITALVFGAFDYIGSLGLVDVDVTADHPLLDGARTRVVKAAASVGVPAIAEMTLNYPTRDKSPEEQRAALDECRRDAERAKGLGFRGKWVGIPAQVPVVNDVFSLSDRAIAEAIAAARAFREAEKAGRGAAMIGGRMHDRANDRMHRVVLAVARALGRLDDEVARELGVGEGK